MNIDIRNAAKNDFMTFGNISHILLLTLASIASVTRSSWLNCALRDDEAVHWVSIGHYEAVTVGN